ncbi:Two-component response regulator PfeR [Pseudomonas paraeruginosa]|nr:Two-component response regulator PfeR [Pseudomonas aeruginosa]
MLGEQHGKSSLIVTCDGRFEQRVPPTRRMIVQSRAAAKGWPFATPLPASCGPADPMPEKKPRQRRFCRKVFPPP